MFKSLLSLAFTASMALGATPAVAQTNWDLPLAWPADNYITKNEQRFADEVKAATNGEVAITLHPGGSLGFKGPEMFSAVRDGLVPIGDMLLNQQVGENKLMGLESLPYLIGSFDELRAFQKHYRLLLDEVFGAANQKVLFTIPWPQQQIFTKTEISTIGDMSGIKIRSYDKSSTEIFQAAGMTPVQLPWGEVIPSLAAGAIDAVATSSPSAIDGAFWEFLKYAYPTRQTWNTNVVSVNLDAWNALSEEQQGQITAIAEKLEPEFWTAAQEVDTSAMKTLADNGMVIGELSEKTRTELRERAAPLREAALNEMGDKAKAVVEAFQKQ